MEIKVQDPFANLIAKPWEVPELSMEEDGGLFVESIVHTITDNLKDGKSKEKTIETMNNGDKKTTEYNFASTFPTEKENPNGLFRVENDNNNNVNLVHSQQKRLAEQEDPYPNFTLYPGNEDSNFDSNTVYDMGVSDDGPFINSIEPASFDKDGNLIKFPEITTNDGNTTESSTLPDYKDPFNDPEAEAQIETIAADSTHGSAKALKALQEELDNHKFSPELMAQDYKQFLEEAGYIKDVDGQLYKSLIGVASALVMGYDVGEAITYGFGAQVEAQKLAKEEQDAKNDQMMDLLKEYGPNMTDDMWDAAIAELGANPNDSTLKFLTLGRDATRKSANAAAELTYIDKMVKLEKELYSLIDNEFNSLEETAEFTTMFNAVATQMRNSKRPGESLDEVAAKMTLTKDRLIGAYGQWENYSKNVAGRPSGDRSLIKPWTWFKEKLPEITTPMVFFEGMHGLIDGAGGNLIPLDPENKPEQYAKATLALHFLDGLEKDFQKNQIIQKDIFKKWSKKEKGQGGKFNNLDNYPDYFYAEVYKMFNARNQRLLAQ